MIPIAKPKAALPVNGIPRFVIIVVVIGKSDDTVELPPTPAEGVLLLVIVFVRVDKTP